MLRRCCFCFDLYKGSLLVAALRLAVWLLIFIGTLWVTVQVFSADRGVIVYQAWLDIEQKGEWDWMSWVFLCKLEDYIWCLR